MHRDAWNSHKWSSAQGQRTEIELDKPLSHHRCSRCKRDFVEDPSTGERYAIYVSVFRFGKLPDLISKQWLRELCPGAPAPYDIEVRRKMIEERSK